jgi:hypothetical protein
MVVIFFFVLFKFNGFYLFGKKNLNLITEQRNKELLRLMISDSLGHGGRFQHQIKNGYPLLKGVALALFMQTLTWL